VVVVADGGWGPRIESVGLPTGCLTELSTPTWRSESPRTSWSAKDSSAMTSHSTGWSDHALRRVARAALAPRR